jgi:LacI family transcriptional regulator
MLAARECGLRVPHDLAIVGTGNIPASAYATVPLTTVDCHPTRLGQEATRLLIRRLAEPDAPQMLVEVPASLVVRMSCGAALPTPT